MTRFRIYAHGQSNKTLRDRCSHTTTNEYFKEWAAHMRQGLLGSLPAQQSQSNTPATYARSVAFIFFLLERILLSNGGVVRGLRLYLTMH